uniref:Uncharacterized protein n=1 Tax=Anopheles atroparvus TaxID=41427 RepID=A0A182JEF8_ANOAO
MTGSDCGPVSVRKMVARFLRRLKLSITLSVKVLLSSAADDAPVGGGELLAPSVALRDACAWWLFSSLERCSLLCARYTISSVKVNFLLLNAEVDALQLPEASFGQAVPLGDRDQPVQNGSVPEDVRLEHHLLATVHERIAWRVARRYIPMRPLQPALLQFMLVRVGVAAAVVASTATQRAVNHVDTSLRRGAIAVIIITIIIVIVGSRRVGGSGAERTYACTIIQFTSHRRPQRLHLSTVTAGTSTRNHFRDGRTGPTCCPVVSPGMFTGMLLLLLLLLLLRVTFASTNDIVGAHHYGLMVFRLICDIQIDGEHDANGCDTHDTAQYLQQHGAEAVDAGDAKLKQSRRAVRWIETRTRVLRTTTDTV